MHPARGVGLLFRQFLFFGLVGAAFLFLIGPALTAVALVFTVVLVVISFVLPFAIIGLLVWIPMRMFSQGPQTAWRDLCQAGRTFGGVAMVLPVKSCFQVFYRTNQARQQVLERARGISCRHGWTLVEMVCGGIVGGLTGAALALQGASFHPGAVLGGIVLGMVLGYLVGRSRLASSNSTVG